MSLSTLVSSISDLLVALRSGSSEPALVDGKILMGRQHVFEQSSPPRVVFIPVSGKYGPKSVSSAWTTGSATELTYQRLHRSVGTDVVSFEVHVWGRDSSNDPDLNYDATHTLSHEVILATHLISSGRYQITDGKWIDGDTGGTNLMRYGNEYVFGLSIETPIVDTSAAALLVSAPSDVAAQNTTNLQPSDGSSPEIGCQDS